VKKAKYKYTCWHCGTGMVISLPAICPECERLLTKEAYASKPIDKRSVRFEA